MIASDDGSWDATLQRLRLRSRNWGASRLAIRPGPTAGFRANFMSLACDPVIAADYFAFCDQDDIWDPNKLEVAVNWLKSVPDELPALYCGRTRLIDEHGRDVGYSPLFARPVSFRNALVQSVAGGNTMVFNNAARALLIEAGGDVDVQTHDWWAYMVVSGCGGCVLYDAVPTVRYRQHETNLVGSNAHLRARILRARRLAQGRFRSMNQRNIAALERLRHRLTPENLAIFERFSLARNKHVLGRILGMRRAGVYCQTLLGNLGLASATLMKKV
jgi:hypothetical protein